MRKTRHVFMWFGILITLILLVPFAEAAVTVVTKYAPYAYGEMYTERGGPLDSCKRIDRAEINKDTGYMYVDMWAKSILWQSHYTLVDFYLGNSHPEQSVYVPSSSLTVTTNFYFKGAMCGNLNTAVARLMVQIIISNEAGWSETYTVADWVLKNGASIQFDNPETYVVEATVPANHYYFVRVRVYTRCDSGASSTAGAWIDFGGEDRYIKLSWIKYEFEESGGGGGGGGCPTLFVWNGADYVEEGALNIHADSDVTVQHEIQNVLALDKGVYKLQLRELQNNTSHIDQVKLYAVDYEGEWHLCPLTYAYHSELGKVKHTLRFDDDNHVDLKPTEVTDLKFAPSIPYGETARFIFEINGYNMKWPGD